jgi:hypothetical protein
MLQAVWLLRFAVALGFVVALLGELQWNRLSDFCGGIISVAAGYTALDCLIFLSQAS